MTSCYIPVLWRDEQGIDHTAYFVGWQTATVNALRVEGSVIRNPFHGYGPNMWRYPDERDSLMAVYKSAYDTGKELGAALAGLFIVQVPPSQGGTFAAGLFFAKLANFGDADGAMDFIRGFSEGIDGDTKKIAPPA